jgi:V8-like Glu-specific endopeptidase
VNYFSTPCLCIGAVLVLAAFPVAADEPVTAAPGFVDAMPSARGSEHPRWTGPGDDEILRIPQHPPIEEIPPMPLQDPLYSMGPPPAEDESDGGAGMALSYDAGSGTLREHAPAPARGDSETGSGSADGYDPDGGAFDFRDVSPRGFGTMTEVFDDSAFPWRMNVKLVMRFVDSGGTDRFFGCSGTMADWETVLTAGHCIYAFSPGGFTINDFAEEVWVYPGWDGNATLAQGRDDRIQHYGVGWGNQYMAFTGWTQDGNWDWDMGLIRVRRAVGALTGWFGWRWGDSCSVIEARTYNLASYPAEGCGTAGLHNGSDMYFWSGGYDGCSGNVQQLELDTTPGCFTAQWGGMSGGGSYLITDDDARQVHAVVSNSNNATFANHTRMWESFKDEMLTFEQNSRGSVFDLQMLRARYLGNTVQAGGSIEGDDYLLVNPTDADEPQRSFSVTHYLSSNDVISSFDTELRTESVTWDFEPRQNLNVNTTGTQYPIPIDLPSGDYFIGALLTSSDGNSSNNSSNGWDSHPVTVQAVTDLVAQLITPQDSTAFLDGFLDVDYRYRNQGASLSSSPTVEIRASTNSIISSSDRLLGSFTDSGLSGTTTRSDSATLSLPDDLAPGNYFIGLITDSSDDIDSGNNTVSSVSSISILGRADLSANDITVAASAYEQGDSIAFSFEIENQGLGASGSIDYRIVLSRDVILTSQDLVVEQSNHPGLASGESTGSLSSSFVLDPGTISPGEYRLGLIVGSGNHESDLADNELVSNVITVAANCSPGEPCIVFEDGFEN